MSNWGIKRKFSLEKYGEDWKECYITFKEIPLNEITKFSGIDEEKAKTDVDYTTEYVNGLIDLLKKNFVEGKIFNGEKVVKMKKEDLDDMPTGIFTDLTSFLFQETTEKKGMKK